MVPPVFIEWFLSLSKGVGHAADQRLPAFLVFFQPVCVQRLFKGDVMLQSRDNVLQ